MAAPLLLLQNIRMAFGSVPLLENAELSVGPGERLCLVGRNGSGKSTLLKIAAGTIEPEDGTRFAQPGATIRYLPQEPNLSGFADVFAYVESGLAPGDDVSRAHYLLGKLGLTGGENTASLSGGEARRAALARVLASAPDILLLDEPTNHLDLPAIEWLEEELRASRGALVLISHDRRFLQNLSRATVWLDRGRTRRLEKGFGDYEVWRDQVLEQEELERHKLDRRIAAEEHWMRYGVTARRKRNQGRLAKLNAMRRERREQVHAKGNVNFAVSDANNTGSLVIEAKGISKSYGENAVVKDFSIRVARGDRLGLVGPNGAGKTTLINLLTGRLSPDSGVIKIGSNVMLATLDQTRAVLDDAASLSDVLTGGREFVDVGGHRRHAVTYMKDFLFTPEQARTPVRVLSGGERARLMLAKALATPSNLLVLDEPTNDLDLETLDLLEELIDDYPGTVLLVSHDRDFLDRVATSVLMAEGLGRFVEYAGGYSDLVAQRGEGVSARAEQQPSKPKESRTRSEAPRRKLTFSDQHALETLPAKMTALERDIAAYREKLSDPGLYARDAKKFAALSDKLAASEAELSAAEERWLELEMLREELARR
ncbi:MAG: ATP-binding cassette domain-containing protein [Alphaproteobacteria bacterium]|nr:ATP-binding cassette domain-containing protein [Alphaproteobacteria bacterium]